MKIRYQNNRNQALILETALFSFVWDKAQRRLLCCTLKLPFSSLIWVNHRLMVCLRWFGRWSYPHVPTQPKTAAERAVARHVAESPTGNSFQNSRMWVFGGKVGV